MNINIDKQTRRVCYWLCFPFVALTLIGSGLVFRDVHQYDNFYNNYLTKFMNWIANGYDDIGN